MDISRIVKWVLVLAVVFVGWKFWSQQKMSSGGGSTSASGGSADRPCVAQAERASDAWGSGIGRFANPPYDIDAWSSFKSDVDRKITGAESACSDSSESSLKVRDAMHDLRALVNDCDSSIRSGAPPSGDIVQRQGQVDAQLDAARELVKSGK